MVMGTPCSGPSSRPFARALSAAMAALRASSERSTTTALSFGLTLRMRSRCASRTSTAAIAPERIAAAVSPADHCQTGPLGGRILADLFDAAFAAAAVRPGVLVVDLVFRPALPEPLLPPIAVFLITFRLPPPLR